MCACFQSGHSLPEARKPTLRLFQRRRWQAGRQRDIILDEGLPLL
jgi:hypothetical protein